MWEKQSGLGLFEGTIKHLPGGFRQRKRNLGLVAIIQA
jgi:hypothetical protein